MAPFLLCFDISVVWVSLAGTPSCGFGGLIGFCVNRVPEKQAYHVVDNFAAHSMTLNLVKSSLLVDGRVITKLLGIRDASLSFADVEEARTIHPSLKA
ncbi:hypothetical protein Hanom_Chr07g00612151 [Helianthus anomalus]